MFPELLLHELCPFICIKYVLVENEVTMGRFLIIVGLFIGLSQLGVLRDLIDPPRDFSSLEPDSVVLYSTSWCGYCAKTRQFFERNNINYVEYDVEKSAAAKRQYDELGGKGSVV